MLRSIAAGTLIALTLGGCGQDLHAPSLGGIISLPERVLSSEEQKRRLAEMARAQEQHAKEAAKVIEAKREPAADRQ